MFRSVAVGVGRIVVGRSRGTGNKPTNFKGKFGIRKPGLSTRKGRKPKPTMTAKKGPVGYYKGNRVGATGTRTRRGGFKKDMARIPKILVPSAVVMAKFKPYVSVEAPKLKVSPPTPQDFLNPEDLLPVHEDADIVAQLKELEDLGIDPKSVI